MQSSLNSRTSKLVTDTIFNFSIDTDFCYYIYNPTTKVTSYTFTTISENPKLQNLVVASDSLQVFTTYLLDYDINKNDFTTINKQQIPNISVNSKLINFNPTNLFNKCDADMQLVCIETWEYTNIGTEPPKNGDLVGEFNNDINSGSQWLLQSTTCSFVYNDGCNAGSDLSSGFITTPTNGSGGSGGNEAISTLNDDCYSLMKMNTVSRNKLKSLKIDAINGNDGGEYGLSFKHDTSGNCLQPVDLQHSPKLFINIPTGNNIYGAAHTHPQTALPMFSFSDVLTLQKLYSQCNPEYSADVVFMLLNNDGSAYAIKVNNLEVLKELTNNYLFATKMTGRQNQIKKADEEFGRYLKNSTNLERAFLEFFPSNALSMYRVTGDFTGYTKLSLPENTSSSIIDKTPCN